MGKYWSILQNAELTLATSCIYIRLLSVKGYLLPSTESFLSDEEFTPVKENLISSLRTIVRVSFSI